MNLFEKPMKKTKSILGACIFAGLLLAGAWVAFHRGEIGEERHFGKPGGGLSGAGQTPGIGVAAARPAVRCFSTCVPWTGVVESKIEVRLDALAAGRIEKIAVADQASVKAGALLMEIGGPRVEARREALAAEIQTLGKQLALARESLARVRQNVAERLATKDDLSRAEQLVLQTEASLKRARLDSEANEVSLRARAPVDGVFTGRSVCVGQAVEAGTPLARVVDPAHLRIVASLHPPRGAEFAGKRVRLRVAGGEDVAEAFIDRVLPEADLSGAVLVWIDGKFPLGTLRPGQSVGGTVVLDERHSLAVPASAVVYGPDERAHVFVKHPGKSNYTRRDVRTGSEQDGWVEILDGLKGDDSVVVRGAHELFYHDFNRQYTIED